MIKSLEDKPTRNPNFGRFFAFEKVKLKRDMLLWPNLVINLFENGIDNPCTHHLVLPTFLFADFLIEKNPGLKTDVKISLALLMYHTTQESQAQQNPLMIYKEMMHEQLMSNLSDDMHDMFSLKLPQTREEVFIQLAQGAAEDVDELHEVVELFQFDDWQQIELMDQGDFDELAIEAGGQNTKGKEAGADEDKGKNKA